ncbi:MAG: hypothetical protein GOVbin212_32 [Prokaryotic dsDNA virus sp.]|nr:MAG: hypothetical protein GOVbin212_32 [Prokaryotic dsDNA virus sp.]|tara:strand:- start:17302 stop:17457 length:156 start_codon:yes stop_codon:yes gene_type:complete
MKYFKWIFLGYLLAVCFHGCDLGITSPSEDFEITNGLGSTPYNPVYVRIVE